MIALHARAAAVLSMVVLNAMQTFAQEDPVDDFANRPAVERSDAELLLEVLAELGELRSEVRRLQESFDTFRSSAIRELQEENRRLRRAVPGRMDEADPAIAFPDGGRDEPATSQEPGKFEYTIVKEWGRTPEDAAAFGEGAVSLKGMLVAVPDWSSDDQIIELGRSLRTKFDACDNLNIEIYKSVESALLYAERGSTNPDDRVMSISRFKDENRDIMLLIRGNDVREISRTDDADQAQEVRQEPLPEAPEPTPAETTPGPPEE